MNLEALDFFNSARFSTSGLLNQPSHDHLGLFKSNLPYSLENMKLQLSPMWPSNCPITVSSPFNNTGVPEVKRPSSSLETKPPQAAPKKSRLDSHSSCPPIKVRKEKLGDRIAALQQLVAPFEKTDTTSVLMEAIGYIKFLQNQVEGKEALPTYSRRKHRGIAALSTTSHRRHRRRMHKRSQRRLLSKREASTDMQHVVADKGFASI